MAFTIAFLGLLPFAAFGDIKEVIKDVRSEAPWLSAPASFRGVPFGASEADLTSAIGSTRCRKAASPAERECTPVEVKKLLVIKGKPVRDTYLFRGGQLVQVIINRPFGTNWKPDAVGYYDPVTFTDVAAALVEQYGPPTRELIERSRGVREATVRRGRSAQIEHVLYEVDWHTMEWQNDVAYVRAVGNANHAAWATVMTAAWKAVQDAHETATKPTTGF